MHHVIIGNGGAGTSALQAIREVDEQAEVTIISSDKHPAYSPCSLPNILSGEIDKTGIFRFDEDFYSRLNARFLSDSRVTRIVPRKKVVELESGEQVRYDRLLISTGAKPITPKSIEGLELEGVHIMGTLESTLSILDHLEQGAKKVVVIGGGFMGIEAGTMLKKRGIDVTIIELLPHVLSRMLDPDMSRKVEEIIRDNKVKLLLESKLIRIVAGGRGGDDNAGECGGGGRESGVVEDEGVEEGSMVEGGNGGDVGTGESGGVEEGSMAGYDGVGDGTVLDDGRVAGVLVERMRKRGGSRERLIECDMVVLAIGVVPDLDVVKGSGIGTGRGILVDQEMRTNIRNIFAAGDAVEVREQIEGKLGSYAIWPNAIEQGRIAGLNMAGVETCYEGAEVVNILDVFGTPVIAMGGTSEMLPEYEEIRRSSTYYYKKLLLRDNKIIGLQFVGDVKNAGPLYSFMKDRLDIRGLKEHLLDETFVHVPSEWMQHRKT